MKVLLVSPFPLPGREPMGGVECAAVALGEGLASIEGIQLKVVSLVSGSTRREEAAWRGLFPVTYLPYNDARSAATGYSAAVTVIEAEAVAFHPDVIHGQGVDAHGFAAVHFTQAVRVLTPHGSLWRDDLLNSHRPSHWARGLLRAAWGRRALGRADGVVAITPERAKGSLERVALIPNPVRPEFSGDLSCDPAPSRTVLVPAAIKRVKGIDRVLKAAATCAGARGRIDVRVAGPVVDEAYRSELTALSASLPDVGVHWLGALTAQQMAFEMDRAQVVALGSLFEVAPISVSEALMRGREVVAPDLPGIRWLTDDGELAQLFVPGSQAALEASLGRALEVAGRLRCRAARNYAEHQFAASAVAQATLDFYSRLSHARRPYR